MTNTDAAVLCTVCSKGKARFCKGCESAPYCTTECQQKDWPNHKLLCSTFSAFDMSSRPTTGHFLAIFFPTDATHPQPVWLHRTWMGWGSDQSPEFRKLFDDRIPETQLIQFNQFRNKELLNTICVCNRDNAFNGGSVSNKSIIRITESFPGEQYDWRGPLMAFGLVGLGRDPSSWRDIDMRDFRHVADHLGSYGPRLFSAQSKIMISGVRINCKRDLDTRPHFEAVKVPLTDPIFDQKDSSYITRRIGLPILPKNCFPDLKLTHGMGYSNESATFLHLSCDPKGICDPLQGLMSFGFAPLHWEDPVGSIIVVRRDNKPLAPLHMEAICNYCQYEISPMFQEFSESLEYFEENGLEIPTHETVLSKINRDTFTAYWHKFLEEKKKEGVDTNISCPYDV